MGRLYGIDRLSIHKSDEFLQTIFTKILINMFKRPTTINIIPIITVILESLSKHKFSKNNITQHEMKGKENHTYHRLSAKCFNHISLTSI